MRVSSGYLDLLRRYVGPEWRRALLLVVLLLATIGLQLLNPQLLRRFIDSALGGSDLSTLVTIALLFMGIAFVTQVLDAFSRYVGEDLGWSATNTLRADLLLHTLRLDPTFHKTRTAGELIERVDGDVTALANFFSRFVVNVLGNGVLLIGVLVVVARESLLAFVAFFIFVLLALGVLTKIRFVAVREWDRVREVSAQMYGFIGEHLAGTEDIRSSGAEWHVMNGLTEHHRGWYRARRASIVKGSLIWTSTLAMFAVGNSVAFATGGYLWVTGVATVGTVYLLFHYIELLRKPIDQLRREIEEIQRALASVGRVEELLRTTSRLPDGRGVPIPSGPLAVDLERVSFAYESDLVLRDVSLRVAPGTVLGVLGRTGSGKTTLARLLMRFYDPTSGAIRLGGVDARDARLADLRGRATLVSQDVQLFHATVRENLTLFDPAIDDARILGVVERIGLAPWLRALPDDRGLDAELRSGALSAGEAQLVAFARVFLRDPGLVILDEASSRLDPATERHIERAIDALLERRTAVVIAHRLATVERCDEIAIVEDGRIVEHGRRTSLAADPGSRFHRLLRVGLEQVLA
ncbi:MAG TPA: ABC transporter ATP-binding protein [Candidatus Limnocylindria bacterium]